MEARGSAIRVGLMGLGVVGGGVVDGLQRKGPMITAQVGCPIEIGRILVRNPRKPRTVTVDPGLLTTDAGDILEDEATRIVIELMGGEEPAHRYIREALDRGKHVVTANKEVMAKHGPELTALAEARGVDILYEASVGGGIPLIAPFKHDLSANQINSVQAIINGTTNYILTRMAQDGSPFDQALREAQELGYAEADPTNDVEGIDAAYKLAILASLAFRAPIRAHDVYHEGISRLAPRDFRYARELGYAIKLLAITKQVGGRIEARVHPALIPEHLLLAKVDGVFNAVYVDGDLIGKVLFYGRGAGAAPTTSAVLADLIDVAHNTYVGTTSRLRPRFGGSSTVAPMDAVETRYYVRLNVADKPGVLAQIATIFGEHLISIASVIQKESDPAERTAELVIMTHPAREIDVRQALARIRELAVVRTIGNFIRVEG